MQVFNNKQLFRFEIPLGEEFATLTYRWLRGSIVLMHTLVPDAERGKGIGGKLVKAVLDYARQQELKIVVYCPFVKEYLERHPEYNDLVDPTHKL